MSSARRGAYRATAADRLAERLSGDVLHDDHELAVLFAVDVVDGHEVAMVQRRADERLATQPSEFARVA